MFFWEPSPRSPLTVLLSLLCLFANLLLDNVTQSTAKVYFGCFATTALVIGTAVERKLLDDQLEDLDFLDFVPGVVTVLSATLEHVLAETSQQLVRLLTLVTLGASCLELCVESYFEGDLTPIKRLFNTRRSKRIGAARRDSSKSRKFLHETGTFLSKYQLGSKLGSGCFGTVLLCVDLDSRGKGENESRCYAAKCILRLKLTSLQVLQVRNEVRILTEIREQHPAIVQLHDFFDEPEHFYIVLELMRGGELFDRINNKAKYYEKDARIVIRTITSALSFLHGRNIVHRDLKPENILLDSDGPKARIKLADFGFARRVDGGCRTACGTPMYVAPEIIDGSIYGESVDIWAVGVITYILLGGVPPFHHSDRKKMFRLIRRADYTFPSKNFALVSFQAQDFIKKCLVVDVKERMSADEVLEHPWVTGATLSTNRLVKSQTSERLDFVEGNMEGVPELTTAKSLLKLFNARTKLKAGILAAIAANKMNDIVNIVKSQRMDNVGIPGQKTTLHPKLNGNHKF